MAHAAKKRSAQGSRRRRASTGPARASSGVEGIALVPVGSPVRVDMAHVARALEAQGIANLAPARLILSREDVARVASGQKARHAVRILPGDAHSVAALPPSPDVLARSLAEAKERGIARKQQMLTDPDLLSTTEFAARLGMSAEGIRLKRKRHEVLGLELAKRGIRYPSWQIVDHQTLLPGLPRLFEILGANPWTIYRFLLQHHPELEGIRALDALRRGWSERVLAAAENLAQGGFA